MSDNGIEFKREELYQKVWATPASKLAKVLGFPMSPSERSAAGWILRKPPLGYWRKIETGQQPHMPSLPAVNENTLISVLIPANFQTEQLALKDP